MIAAFPDVDPEMPPIRGAELIMPGLVILLVLVVLVVLGLWLWRRNRW